MDNYYDDEPMMRGRKRDRPPGEREVRGRGAVTYQRSRESQSREYDAPRGSYYFEVGSCSLVWRLCC